MSESWSISDFHEIIRLINLFFPESKEYINTKYGILIYYLIDSMEFADDFHADYSCDPFGIPAGPDLGFQKLGGFDGKENAEAYQLLIKHTGFSPSGRAVAIRNALGMNWKYPSDDLPFVCKAERLPERLDEMGYFFGDMNDSILVFESGEVICVDHDNRIFWAKSRIRRLRECNKS